MFVNIATCIVHTQLLNAYNIKATNTNIVISYNNITMCTIFFKLYCIVLRAVVAKYCNVSIYDRDSENRS